MTIDMWAPISRYPQYEANANGDIRNKKTGRILRPGIKNNGYRVVVLRHDNKSHTEHVHRLVAEAFYGVNDDSVVNHKDGDKRNNAVENLEFVSYGENLSHAYTHGLRKTKPPIGPKRPVRIVETGEVFDTIRSCADAIHGNRRHISDCLNGKLKTDKNYHFEEV